MIAEEIPKTTKTLEERGLPADSYFEVVFQDGSSVCEKDTNWSAMSRKEEVEYFFGHRIMGFISNYPIKSIKIRLNDIEASIDDIPEGTEVFQFMQSQRLLGQHIDKQMLVGRGIGLIKEGKVIEERFINALENKVEGMRK